MSNIMQVENLPGFFTVHKCRAWCIIFAMSVASMFTPVHAQDDERSGKEVVDTVCVACHATGVNGAPKIGDKEAWSSRDSQGLSNLTLHALDGIRNMPAHGGDPKLSDLEIARAVTYMVNQSGGNWVAPVSAKDLATERSGEQIVKVQCSKCHAEGVGGAPKIGDLQAWVPRIKNGLPYLVNSAIHGHGGMPPRGGQANLTDAELSSAILYMYNPGATHARSAPTVAAKPVPTTDTDPNHKSVDGIEIYLGLMPAEDIDALPKDSPERTMHGGIPKGSGYYHVNVSLFDGKTRTPINNAQVRMQFDWPGLDSIPVELEPMMLGGSYGNYVKPQPGTSYRITLRIKIPGATRAIVATFEPTFFE
jgi:cytochrome c5